MRAVSQIMAAILMVGLAVVAVSVLSYVAIELMSSYRPAQKQLALVGGVTVELQSISRTGNTIMYTFAATAKLVNLGTDPITIDAVSIIFLARGTETGRATTITCSSSQSMTIAPGETKPVVATCLLDSSKLTYLFGSSTPPADEVKSSLSLVQVAVFIGPERIAIS